MQSRFPPKNRTNGRLRGSGTVPGCLAASQHWCRRMTGSATPGRTPTRTASTLVPLQSYPWVPSIYHLVSYMIPGRFLTTHKHCSPHMSGCILPLCLARTNFQTQASLTWDPVNTCRHQCACVHQSGKLLGGTRVGRTTGGGHTRGGPGRGQQTAPLLAVHAPLLLRPLTTCRAVRLRHHLSHPTRHHTKPCRNASARLRLWRVRTTAVTA
jgi:hypothetical protein